MEPVRQNRDFSWANLNPFAKADRGEISPQPQQRQSDKPIQDAIDDNDPNKEIKNKDKGGEGDDPLLQFENLWHPNVDKEGNPIVEDNTPQGYLPKLDSKKLGDLVNKMNFTDGITEEEMTAMKAGGEGAVTANLAVLNRAARKAFTVSLSAATRLTEQGFTNAQGRFTSEIPEHVRGMLTDNELSGSIGILKNPAFAPVVDSVKQQYLKKFPKAGPKEVNSAVKQYFDYMAKEMTKKPDADLDTNNSNTKRLKAGDPNADFLQWIEKEIPGTSSMFNDDDSGTVNQTR